MSMQQTALQTRAASGRPAALEARMPTAADVAGIRRQATDLIEEVLSGTDPHQAKARDELRRLVAAHPGHPETALAEDLLRVRGLTLVSGARPYRLPLETPAERVASDGR